MAIIRITEETLHLYRPFSPLPLTLPPNAPNGSANGVGSHFQNEQPGGESIVAPDAENLPSGHGTQREKG